MINLESGKFQGASSNKLFRNSLGLVLQFNDINVSPEQFN